MIVKPEMIGGATVRRAFNNGSRRMRPGETMSREECLRLPSANRQSLIDTGFIAVHPHGAPAAPAAGTGGERHVVSAGFGKFNVFEGRKLNDDPLTKAEAEALASQGTKTETKTTTKTKTKRAA